MVKNQQEAALVSLVLRRNLGRQLVELRLSLLAKNSNRIQSDLVLSWKFSLEAADYLKLVEVQVFE
jgi:hypothetical protein